MCTIFNAPINTFIVDITHQRCNVVIAHIAFRKFNAPTVRPFVWVKNALTYSQLSLQQPGITLKN